MEIARKRETAIIITTVSFLITFLPYFFPIPALDVVQKYTVDWALITSYFMAIVGFYYLTKVNLIRLQKRPQGWLYGIITVILVWYMCITGFAFGTGHMSFKFFYDAIALSLTAMVGAIQGFYLVGAGNKIFRFRDVKSSFLLGAAVVILLKNAPVTTVIFPGIQPVGTYLIDILVNSANRAFKIGTAIAGIALGIRVLLGKESSQVGLATEG
jgi:hypothetical protein